MTAPRPRNDDPASAGFRVGRPREQVSGSRRADGGISLNAYNGTGVTVRLSAEEARELYVALGRLLDPLAGGPPA